jgi:alpha-glucosidase
LLTLRGTPTLYYGDELGMRDVPIAPELVRDPWEKNVPGLGLGRDPERTPMQWTPGPNAGFGTGTPWLPIAADADTVNVQSERADPASLLSFQRAVLSLRKREEALSIGSFTLLQGAPNLLCFQREHEGKSFVIVLNFSSEERVLSPFQFSVSRLVLSTIPARKLETFGDSLTVSGNEGLVLTPSNG